MPIRVRTQALSQSDCQFTPAPIRTHERSSRLGGQNAISTHIAARHGRLYFLNAFSVLKMHFLPLFIWGDRDIAVKRLFKTDKIVEFAYIYGFLSAATTTAAVYDLQDDYQRQDEKKH